MIVSITTWLIVVLDVLVTLSVTALIGKPQKPLTEGTAAWSVVILAVFGILLFLSWEQVHTAPSKWILAVVGAYLAEECMRTVLRTGITPNPRTARYAVWVIVSNAAEVFGLLYVWTHR